MYLTGRDMGTIKNYTDGIPDPSLINSHMTLTNPPPVYKTLKFLGIGNTVILKQTKLGVNVFFAEINIYTGGIQYFFKYL